jgi:1-acyl-sn-glycerol-3-phosphate acyltransferase
MSKYNFHDFTYWLIRKTVGPIIRALWVKKVTGLNHIPKKGAAILAFNHQSYFDFLCFVAIAPRNVHFLSAEKFFTHPVWKHVMKYTRQIKVERSSDDKQFTHQTVLTELSAGKLIGIFPEGTRSPHENTMLKAFVGIAMYSLNMKLPIIPVGIKGTFDVMAKHHKKPHFKKVVSLHIGEPMHFPEYHGISDRPVYEKVTHKVMLKISELSGKEYPHEHN